MQAATETRKGRGGRSAEDIVESEAGGMPYRALVLLELQAAVEAGIGEFGYEDEPAAVELVRLAEGLHAHLAKVFMRDDGGLTTDHACRRCSGEVGDGGCSECAGSGVTREDDA